MSTATTTTIWSNATDAGFRAWGKWLSDQLAAFGWVLVGSSFATGSSWADVTAPAAANTARVTELWRMNDALQATAPLFMLIDYGETTTADGPAIRIRLGTGGSGTTLSGQFYDTTATYFGSTAITTNSMTHYASGDSGRFSIAFVVSGTGWANTMPLGFGIQRRKDANGADVGTGWLFTRYASSSTRGHLAFKQDGSNSQAGVTLSGMHFPVVHSAEANLTFDGKVAVTPQIFCGVGPMEMGINFVALPQALYGPGSTFTCDVYGASHTFITLNDLGSLTVLAGSGANLELAMRYE